jgi:alpha-amylase
VFYTQLNPRILNSSSTFTQLFSFGGQQPQTSNEFKATSADFSGKLLNAKSVILDGNGRQIASLEVEPVDFIWNHPAVNQPPQYKGGQKGAIIEMFGWPYEEIEKECASLGKMG